MNDTPLRGGVSKLPIPLVFRSIGEFLDHLKQHGMKAILLVETEDGKITFEDTNMTLSETIWILERMKHFILDVGSQK
jgi:hypothetical protein